MPIRTDTEHTHHHGRRTTVIVDDAQLEQAREILGTNSTTATIRCALIDVVNRHKRRQLAAWDLGGMSLEDLETLRRGRAGDETDAGRRRGPELPDPSAGRASEAYHSRA